MKIMIVGAGYVGLTIGIGFAELGHEVVCYDKDNKKIAWLNQNSLLIKNSIPILYTVLTGWRQFEKLDLERIKHCMIQPLMLDFHNIVGKNALDKNGFRYYIRKIAEDGGVI